MITDKKKLEKEAEISLNYYRSGNYAVAESRARKLLKINRQYVFLYNILGLSLTKQKKFIEAIKIFRQGIAVKPNSAILHNNLGNALNAVGKTDEAYENYIKSIKINPKFSLAYNNLGNLLKDQNKFEDAIKNFNEAIKYQADFFVAYHNLATVYQYLGKFDEAMQYYDKVKKINPGFYLADRQLSSSIEYTKDNPHFLSMKKEIEKKNLTDDQKMNLSFGLGKAYEDIKNFDLSFKNYLNGNKLKRKMLNYSIEKDKKLFDKIKISFNKKNLNDLDNNLERGNNLIFILGMPRSGTSLVEQILSSHPDVYGAGELRTLSLLVRKLFFNKDEFIFKEKIEKKDIASLEELSKEYFANINKYKSKEKFVTDKTPLNFIWLGIIKIAFPQAKVIHCVRDPKDNCLSIFKNYFAGRLDFSYELSEIIEYYNIYKNLMKFWHSMMPNFIYDIQYESLIKNQKQEIKKVLEACNLKWNDKCLLFHENKRAIKTASAIQARKPIYKSSVKGWKNYEKYLKSHFEKLIN